MNRKNLQKRLNNMGYVLTREHYGWLVRSTLTGFPWSFKDLSEVQRFTTDEESLKKFNTTQKKG